MKKKSLNYIPFDGLHVLLKDSAESIKQFQVQNNVKNFSLYKKKWIS